MSQLEIDDAVANATGEKLGVIQNLGFSLADPFEVDFGHGGVLLGKMRSFE